MSFRFPTQQLKEGKAEIIVPKPDSRAKGSIEHTPSKAPVFYNPAMELNRDFAVLALGTHQRALGREVVICEPLAGCGVRGLRLVLETEGVRSVVINDISSAAAELAQSNVRLNGLTDRVLVSNEDANFLLSRFAAPRKRFDYIDIDPFGSPVPYVDSALRALRNGGLFALTATDMAPLCGVHPKACIRKYGAKPLRVEYCHELAIRMLIGCLASMAAKHDIGIHPAFSYSKHNYVRTYARVSYGAKEADKSIATLGYILHCFSCFHRESQKGIDKTRLDCPECGSRLQMAGPLWLGSLSDNAFCKKMLNGLKEGNLRNRSEVYSILTLSIGETDAPIAYYVVDKICDKLSLRVPSLSRVVEALRNSGFQVALTHFNPRAVRTDASATALKGIVTELSGSGVRKSI